MRRLPVAVAVVAVFCTYLTGVAFAGGFATVGLSSLPDGTQPGKPWNVELTILQHGRTPTTGLEPSVRIFTEDGKKSEIYPATPVKGKDGHYTASVVFPTAGKWNYEVDDGFSQVHSYAPVTIAEGDGAPAVTSGTRAAPQTAPAVTGDDDGKPFLAALGAGLVAALLAGGAATLLMRRFGSSPAAAS